MHLGGNRSTPTKIPKERNVKEVDPRSGTEADVADVPSSESTKLYKFHA